MKLVIVESPPKAKTSQKFLGGGEAIHLHIKQLIGDHKTKRVAFHEITEEAVKESFLAPREINQQLVDSQQARRGLDRVVGYQLFPLLWKKVRYVLLAG